MLPRISSTFRSGRSARIWQRRRRLPVPTFAPLDRSAIEPALADASTSRGSSRAGTADDREFRLIDQRHGNGHVLKAVDGEVDLPRQQMLFKLLREQPLAAKLVKRAVLNLVAGGLADDEFDFQSGMTLLDRVGHHLALHAREHAAARAQTEGVRRVCDAHGWHNSRERWEMLGTRKFHK